MLTTSAGTLVTGPGASITDANGHTWVITNEGQISVDGQVDQTTANVDALGYTRGQVWQKNGSDNWYAKVTPSDTWVDWLSKAPPMAIPGVSANGAWGGLGTALTDAEGNVWQVVPGTPGRGNQVAVDGVIDPRTANVTNIRYISGAIWQQNTAGSWWSATSPSGDWTGRLGVPANTPPTRCGFSAGPDPPVRY